MKLSDKVKNILIDVCIRSEEIDTQAYRSDEEDTKTYYNLNGDPVTKRKEIPEKYEEICERIEDEEYLLLNYELFICELDDVDSLGENRVNEYLDLEKQLEDSIKRKYAYLLIEELKNNLDKEEMKEVAEFIKDLNNVELLENLDKVFDKFDLELESVRDEDLKIRREYLDDLVKKKHLLLLIEFLDSDKFEYVPYQRKYC